MKTTIASYVTFVSLSLMLWSGCFGHRIVPGDGVAASVPALGGVSARLEQPRATLLASNTVRSRIRPVLRDSSSNAESLKPVDTQSVKRPADAGSRPTAFAGEVPIAGAWR